MISRYFLFISYNGTSYHGWQIQPDSVTVQEVLEKALSVVLNEKIKTTGAGRTDTGVHATLFCAHFDSQHNDLETNKNIVYRLNSFLPKDISVKTIRKVLPSANARFSAISRTYLYYISRFKDPFFDNSSWYIYGNLDITLMNQACSILTSYSDFTSFSRLHSDTKTNICRIYDAKWIEKSDFAIFEITADRFLRNMVRAIVGTMADIGMGKINLNEFETIIISKNRSNAGKSAPAKGLFLTDIKYPSDIFYLI